MLIVVDVVDTSVEPVKHLFDVLKLVLPGGLIGR